MAIHAGKPCYLHWTDMAGGHTIPTLYYKSHNFVSCNCNLPLVEYHQLCSVSLHCPDKLSQYLVVCLQQCSLPARVNVEQVLIGSLADCALIGKGATI